MHWNYPRLDQQDDLERVLIDEDALQTRVRELGDQLSKEYAGRRLVMVSVLKGGMLFLADLMRHVNVDLEIELMGASSYKGGVSAAGGVRITKDVDQSLAAKHVLLVEDIFDTGRTLRVAYELIKLHGPASVEICCLVLKHRAKQDSLQPKYVGFEIADEFVVGYGLDYRERYRNLPVIGVLKKEMYEQ